MLHLHRKKLWAWLGIGVFLSLSLLWLANQFCLAGYLSSVFRPQGLPTYIANVWPPPAGWVTSDCYDRNLSQSIMFSFHPAGIEVSIGTDSIYDQVNFDIKHGEFYERVFLYVDGKQIPNSFRRYMTPGNSILRQGHLYNIEGYYIFSWNYPLPPGSHTAKVAIITPLDKFIEYEWHFEIK